jgi:hypothetical protein
VPAGASCRGVGIRSSRLTGRAPRPSSSTAPERRPLCATCSADSEVVILCVTGSPQVAAVLTGADGVLAGMRPGTIVVDCSTAIPESTVKMAQAVQAAGGRFVDAPMTRLPKQAREGRLKLLVGGEAALFEALRPILACFAENITHVGPVAAHAVHDNAWRGGPQSAVSTAAARRRPPPPTAARRAHRRSRPGAAAA